ncbi:hypothetical protein Pse7367_2318 [Thalassoporum mexicanum PCC 7367]|uniref:hypothetical protein n=1 Tax=Thalassoporum mexicanum TaxID=3457544 RepID=UPI00029FE800|nr:hypothetical protein [Pseudanabaena sp. PCC 7367]AFY70580.1 hypothetical protein Pse7367_2318 [Pseudanabaena sp. PCC 7367]
MERGLMWLPLLALFIGLAWAGWREYQKVEAYQTWAQEFDRHKYDIYAVLGQKGDRLVWGKPTRQAPIEVQSASLAEVAQIELKLDGASIAIVGRDPDINQRPDQVPAKAKLVEIELGLNSGAAMAIPFTDVAIAMQWFRYLAEQISDRNY